MIGVVVATHGRLAEELINAMIHGGGLQKNIASGSIGPDDDYGEAQKRYPHICGKR